MLDPDGYFPAVQTVDPHRGRKGAMLLAKPERLEGGCLLYRLPLSNDEWPRRQWSSPSLLAPTTPRRERRTRGAKDKHITADGVQADWDSNDGR